MVPDVTVKDTVENITLSAGTDYTVNCLDVNVGAATAIITGKGNYTGTFTKSFTIVPKNHRVPHSISIGNDEGWRKCIVKRSN